MDLTNIPLKNNLLKDKTYNDVKNKIIEYVNTLGDISKYRNCNQFLLLVINLIENSIVKTDKISKKELVIDIYKSIFGITDDASIDLMTLDNSIEFLISNNKVSKVGMRKLIVKGVGNWFYKKFL